MYNENVLLAKAGKGTELHLARFCGLSAAEIHQEYQEELDWGEAQFLAQQAEKLEKQNRMLEAGIFSRANPQLASTVRSGILQSRHARSYESQFGSRADTFVSPDSVASMFSPAAYLTVLYREALELHEPASMYNLHNRRPDLASLQLSQSNMDEEVSTLALANGVLLGYISRLQNIAPEILLEKFASHSQTSETPYSQPFETTRLVLLNKDPTLSVISQNHEVAYLDGLTSLMPILSNVSPGLHEILTQEITTINAQELYDKHFPNGIDSFSLTDFYNLSVAELSSHLLHSEYYEYINNHFLQLYIESGNSIKLYDFKRISEDSLTEEDLLELGDAKLNNISLFHHEGNTFEVRVKIEHDISGLSALGLLYWDLENDLPKFIFEEGLNLRAGDIYRRFIDLPLINDVSDISLYAEFVGEDTFNSNGGFTEFYKAINNLGCKIKQGELIKLLSSAQQANPREGGIYIDVVNISKPPPHVGYLKINKLIRISQATGLFPAQINAIMYSVNNTVDINSDTLQRLYFTQLYQARYNLDFSTALILSGANINNFIVDGQLGHFDRLFNSPPLGGRYFNISNNKISLTSEVGDNFESNVLMRGLGINAGELQILAKMIDDSFSDTFPVNQEFISHLFRLRWLAKIHEFSIQEFNLIYSVSPVKGLNVSSLTLLQWNLLAEFLYQTRILLNDMRVTATEYYLLCTERSSTTLTPEMLNLLSLIRSRLGDLDIDIQDREWLTRELSPFVTAAFSLSSPAMALNALLWNELLRPDVISIEEFAQLSTCDNWTNLESEQLALYCHALAQTCLIIQKLMLSEAEVASFVHSGNKLVGGDESADRASLLRSLNAFHQWLNGLGTHSSEMLIALEQGTMKAERLSFVMNTEPLMIEQAMACAEVDNLDNWQKIYLVLQWINVSDVLNVMPATIQKLLSLQSVSLSDDSSNDENWLSWQHLAHAMEASIEGRAARELESLTAERYSTVLSAWFRTYCQPAGTILRNRDELYSYLLIDNQVSAQVRTSRLAEAIASLQLYINRALNRMEDDTRTDVISRPFFLDWSLYSRYSSWSGVSMLAYYPENYIDPTLRIGQTRMMDELLENISQGKLSQDSVEDAFKTYLTRFETVADLTVVSAYHDNVNSDSGTTWLLGRSKENLHEYHWRTVNMSKLHHGTLPANAWGEWTRIEMPLNAWQDMIRPVVFRDRLYLIWVERNEIAVTDSNQQVSMIERFTLKLAFRKHDGSWSAPWSQDVTTEIEKIPTHRLNPLALSASGFNSEGTLLVFIYRVSSSYEEFGHNNSSVVGLMFRDDGTFLVLEPAYLSRYSIISQTFDTAYNDYGGIKKKASYRFSQLIEIPDSLKLNSVTLDGRVSLIDNAFIKKIKYIYDASKFEIFLENPTFTFRFTSRSALGNQQLIAMNNCGSPGDAFIISQASTNSNLTSVYNKASNRIGIVSPSSRDKTRIDFNITNNWRGNPVFTTGWSSGIGMSSVINVAIDRQRDFKNTHFTHFISEYTIDHGGNPWEPNPDGIWGVEVVTHAIHSTQNSRWIDIETSLDEKSAVIRAGSNGWEQKFYASDTDVIANLPVPSFNDMNFRFNSLKLDVPGLAFTNNSSPIEISFSVKDRSGKQVALARNTLIVEKVDFSPENIIQLHSTDTGAQYMQLGVHRIRLNTLLGPQLVSLAATGIDAILSMSTQHLPEPQLGKGFYVSFVLPSYNPDVHGNNRNFRLHLGDVLDYTHDVIYSGQFQDNELTVRLFIPQTATPLDDRYVAKVFLTTQRQPTEQVWIGAFFTDNNGAIGLHSNSDISMFSSVNILSDTTEPMDFNGACALYFWELFYYTPMMAFQRLLQEQNFSEATRWLNYVWNPAGYIVEGDLQRYLWNVRPLEEETSWNASPLDSVDPDAVAQADPMHYKVATFMRMLDLLIARGDRAYRQLERDTLNEAKMWYVQALALLGDEPDLTFSAHWGEPTLMRAADKTLRQNYQLMLARIRESEELPETRTANSLTGLFLPEFNEALSDYWKTLRQRLFNLRNNLTIDGMPLSLPLFADRADPSQLLSSMVLNAQESSHLPVSTLTLWRFPVMLERARNTVAQLTQFGASLLSLAEHQDADEINTLLMQQGMELITQSIRLQERVVDEVAADREVILETRRGVQERLATYQYLWDENISRPEQNVMNMQTSAGSASLGAEAFLIGASIADIAPNIFGLAVGGSRWGASLQATADIISVGANATLIAADRMALSESYRRRREEWQIQRDAAESELRQLDAQLRALEIRQEAAGLQVDYLHTQQEQTLAQMEFLQRKFTNQALYNWMRGKLSAIYYQFFDLSQSLCLMAQASLRRELNDPAATFIRGGAWNGASAGFMAGETLLLNLAEMEKVWLERDARAFEVTRTVSLARVYRTLESDSFELKDRLPELLASGSGGAGQTNTEIQIAGGQLQASVHLSQLAINDDYPANLGGNRKIKQISVTLPALVGPYEDVRAVLNYGGSFAGSLSRGCDAIAVSHGMNDSGQFVLDFDDPRWLPFEGIPVDDNGSLTLSFPDATGRQKALLQSLNDIILHIRYTIQP